MSFRDLLRRRRRDRKAAALLRDRTPEQIAEGRLADGKLDPRGYVVFCRHPRCYRQWWGTPDNLPIKRPTDCRNPECVLVPERREGK